MELEAQKEDVNALLQVPRPLDIRIRPDSLKNERTPLIEVLKEGEQEDDKETGKESGPVCVIRGLQTSMGITINSQLSFYQ